MDTVDKDGRRFVLQPTPNTLRLELGSGSARSFNKFFKELYGFQWESARPGAIALKIRSDDKVNKKRSQAKNVKH